MKITVFTPLPDFFDVAKLSIMGRSLQAGLWSFDAINFKDYGLGGYKQTDDTTYGGGSGMILRADVLGSTLEHNIDFSTKPRILLTSPRGKKFNQKIAQDLAQGGDFYIVSNRFEGIDQRAIDYYNLEEISIGDYVLFGGDVAAMVIMESVIRLIPGVIDSHDNEDSFCGELENKLEYDHYTKPSIWKNLEVPAVLQNGNHAEIKKWRMNNAKDKI